MFVKRFYEPSLAQASYLIGCAASGEALVIDPNRDVDQYITAAADENLRIAHVTETHIHADYVSGARELAHRTGAVLYLSDEGDADWKYQFVAEGRTIRQGDRIEVGRVKVDVLHTPGHTPEHLTFLITDSAAADRPIAAATGDFIFVGDVGRPDLLERAAHIAGTMEKGARQLWASLRTFAAREDWLQLWPGHGAGSACGKGISAIPQSTLGYERRFNWAFQVKTENEFVDQVLAGQPDPPPYFALMKAVNKAGPRLLGGFTAPPRLDDSALAAVLARGAVVVDTRPAERYAAAHVPGTLNIPLNASFLTWAGWLVPHKADLHLIVDAATAAQVTGVVRLLALIGLDRVSGYFLESAITHGLARGERAAVIPQMTVEQLGDQLGTHLSAQPPEPVTIVDVRSASEWGEGHVPGALHLPLGHLEARASEIPAGKPIVVHCQLGARSAIAASLLRRLGHANVINLAGGYAAWRRAGFPSLQDQTHAPAPTHS